MGVIRDFHAGLLVRQMDLSLPTFSSSLHFPSSKNLLLILFLHLRHLHLQRYQQRHLLSLWHPLVHHVSSWHHYLLPSSNSLGANCSRTGLEPKELLSSFSVGRSVYLFSFSLETVALSFLDFSTPRLREIHSRMVLAKGTLTLKWEFGVRHSVLLVLDDDVSDS